MVSRQLAFGTRPFVQRAVPTSTLLVALLALTTAIAAAVWTHSVPTLILWTLPLLAAFVLHWNCRRFGAAWFAAAGILLLWGMQFLPDLAAASGLPPLDGRLAGAIVIALLLIGPLAEPPAAQGTGLADPLTGIPGPRPLEMFLDAQIAAARRGRNVTVIRFGLDQYETLCARLGRAAGRRALRELALVLDRNTRSADLSGRLREEQFLTILPGTGAEGAYHFASRVQRSMDRLMAGGGIGFPVSAGIAAYSPQAGDATGLLDASSEALDAARRMGGYQALGVKDWGRPAAGMRPQVRTRRTDARTAGARSWAPRPPLRIVPGGVPEEGGGIVPEEPIEIPGTAADTPDPVRTAGGGIRQSVRAALAAIMGGAAEKAASREPTGFPEESARAATQEPAALADEGAAAATREPGDDVAMPATPAPEVPLHVVLPGPGAEAAATEAGMGWAEPYAWWEEEPPAHLRRDAGADGPGGPEAGIVPRLIVLPGRALLDLDAPRASRLTRLAARARDTLWHLGIGRTPIRGTRRTERTGARRDRRGLEAPPAAERRAAATSGSERRRP